MSAICDARRQRTWVNYVDTGKELEHLVVQSHHQQIVTPQQAYTEYMSTRRIETLTIDDDSIHLVVNHKAIFKAGGDGKNISGVPECTKSMIGFIERWCFHERPLLPDYKDYLRADDSQTGTPTPVPRLHYLLHVLTLIIISLKEQNTHLRNMIREYLQLQVLPLLKQKTMTIIIPQSQMTKQITNGHWPPLNTQLTFGLERQYVADQMFDHLVFKGCHTGSNTWIHWEVIMQDLDGMSVHICVCSFHSYSRDNTAINNGRRGLRWLPKRPQISDLCLPQVYQLPMPWRRGITHESLYNMYIEAVKTGEIPENLPDDAPRIVLRTTCRADVEFFVNEIVNPEVERRKRQLNEKKSRSRSKSPITLETLCEKLGASLQSMIPDKQLRRIIAEKQTDLILRRHTAHG